MPQPENLIDRAAQCLTAQSACALMSTTMDETIKQYLARIGAKGGKTTGETKRRGGKEFYRRLAKKGWASRKRSERKGRAAK